MQERTQEVTDRFWSYVDKTRTCWLWAGGLTTQLYGQFNDTDTGKVVRAHRHAYELLVGPIPEGMTIDHLCMVRHCVRPDHLEPVTMAVNNQRAAAYRIPKTHCRNGHPYDDENTLVYRGYRYCRACHRDRQRERRRRQAQQK